MKKKVVEKIEGKALQEIKKKTRHEIEKTIQL